MKQIIIIATFCLLGSMAFSQQYYTVSGYVKEKRTGEVLIGASVYDANTKKGTTSNSYGFYSFSLPVGNYTIAFSFMGYKTGEVEIELTQNITKDVLLENSSIDIESITISSSSSANPVSTNEFHTEKLTMKNIEKLPSMLGDPDVIKAIQLQSGVKTLGDGSSGMFVRGGSNDQNLILIDEAPIYNPSHLFGLVSVFNPDALNHVDLYKSNMPAEYGGRVSSVIDCKTKEGNMNQYDFSAGLSPFSFTLTANGPIVKEKSSFFVSGRKSLVDLFLSPGPALSLVPAYYDLNVKANTHIGNNNRLFVSFYTGNDVLESVDNLYNTWGNTSGTLRWNSNLGSRLFLNTSFIVSDYQNYLEFKEEGRDYKWQTGVSDLNLKVDLSYYLKSGNTIKAGLGSVYHKFVPGENSDTLQSIPRIQAFEHSFYVAHNTNITQWLGIDYGLRLSIFQNYGEATWYKYNEAHNPIGTKHNSNGVYNTYTCLEPRVSINVKQRDKQSFKLAYARNAQYMQVLQNNSLSYTSLETWFPANPNIDPIIADVFSLGWFRNLSEPYLVSVELYYKAYQNQIDYVDHASLINNPYIEGEIRKGTARAYGAEINLNKQLGRLTGNISYTYSRAFRTIEEINNNEEYSSPFDIPHDYRITASYAINESWDLGATWSYMSGRPVTLPVGFYEYDSRAVPIYTERNSSRFPHYHRMDIAFNYNPPKDGKKIDWSVNFGLFNAYGRKNPIGYEFDLDMSTGVIKAYQYTLFTFLPNFSVKAKF